MVKKVGVTTSTEILSEKEPASERHDNGHNGISESYHESGDDEDVVNNGSDSDTESSVYSGLSESDDEVSCSDEQLSDEDNDLSDNEINLATEKSDRAIISRIHSVDELNPKTDEYEYDSSDEEDIRNTVGNIPMKWYDEYQHLGYDWDGRRIMKPKSSDELDKFLTRMEDPNYWKTVHDPSTGRDVVLSNKDVELINNIQKAKYPDKNYHPYAPWIDFFSYDTMIHAVTNQPEHKRSFVPSYIEKRKVSKLVHTIKMGYYKPKPEKKEDDDVSKYYLIWDKQDPVGRRLHNLIPAPKMKLPGHEESYNPPPEYILNEQEEKKWKIQEPEERRIKFLPQKHDSLRQVPAYDNFIQERFERCLDLYLCPRQQKMRMNIDPEDLIPKLPKPKDLQPFPSVLTLIYKGHNKMVRCLTVEPYGQFIASGCDDCTVKIWEVLTGRCFATIKMDGPVHSIAWCPNGAICAISVAVNKSVIILNPKVGDKLIVNNTDMLLTSADHENKARSSTVQWRTSTDLENERGYRIVIDHPNVVKQVTWHCKGDYFATVMEDAGNKSVFIHQLTKRHSQQPFSRSKGLVQCVLFHPTRPYFFVATQRYVRIYNLLKQELSKKLLTNSKWVSSIAVHPGGDNLIIGTYDCRLSWFDLDLSTKPYQTLRHHTKALRKVTYHRRYPLFASASDDGSVIVCHGMVYNDLLQNAFIVPVKVLTGHETRDGLSVLDCQFHSTQPWIFTAGADGNIFLYT